jgi:hypothetical protein
VAGSHDSAAAGVRFGSESHGEAFISTDVGIIEDSWIQQTRPLPGPDVVDLAEPEQRSSLTALNSCA